MDMRLYNIYYVCKMAMEDLSDVEIHREIVNGFPRMDIINLNKYENALETLSNLEFIKDYVRHTIQMITNIRNDNKFINSTINGKILTTVNISGGDEANLINNQYSTIFNKVQSIIDLYESMKETKHQIGIDINIPPCQYLHEYLSILKDIDFIISQCPYLRSSDEDIQYDGADVGSDWITLVIVSTGAVATTSYILNNFAQLTKKVQEIRVRFQKIKQNEEFLKTMNIKNELLEQMKNVYESEVEETFRNAIHELKEELGNLNDGEEESKVLKSLQKYNDLLDRGVQFYSSIESSPEIKELLPSSDDPKALTDTIVKYIEKKDDKD